MTAYARRTLQPVFVALLVAGVSALALVALIQLVLATGGGLVLSGVVLLVATAVLVVVLGLLFRRADGRSHWSAAILLALVALAVYVALFVTGTQRFSIVALGPVVSIVAVALAAGAASTVTRSGGWRVLGVVGVLGLVWLVLTPVLVAL